jgi:hypothetical protein
MNPRCLVCTSPDRAEIDRYLSNQESVRKVAAWTVEAGNPLSRPTIQKHLAHALLISESVVVERTVTRTSPSQFLQAVVDVGADKIEKNPDKVSVDQAIRAADILERKRDDGAKALNILVLALTGHKEPPALTGEYRQIVEGA